ncbi:replication protein [Acinetobacter baumannii]|uniref:replication protein n=1 Tax=Acinetobacter baumannii TaxID=470 RepID=UPI0022A3CCAF|nr:replication protein [Acinetobacter baumannii]MCZ6923870.1 replication protein [Acinetobacter baumannii]HCT6227327.1 replication protein [Acinetobacter baumannii]
MSSFISNAFMLPNDLIDKGYMALMKGPALPCYIFIVRKTRGWNKSDDSISVSQLVKGTGYNKDSVLKGCEKLVQMGVIERKSFANQPAKYVLTDSIFAVDILDSENIAGENIEGGVDILDSTLSKDSTHNNNSKTTITKANIYKEKFNFANALVSQGADQKLISEYMEVRKAKKAVNSETAFKSLISEQQKSGLTLNQVLEHCVVNSWKGFKAEWIKNQSTVHGQQNKPSRWDEIQELIAKEEAGNEQYGF